MSRWRLASRGGAIAGERSILRIDDAIGRCADEPVKTARGDTGAPFAGRDDDRMGRDGIAPFAGRARCSAPAVVAGPWRDAETARAEGPVPSRWPCPGGAVVVA